MNVVDMYVRWDGTVWNFDYEVTLQPPDTWDYPDDYFKVSVARTQYEEIKKSITVYWRYQNMIKRMHHFIEKEKRENAIKERESMKSKQNRYKGV